MGSMTFPAWEQPPTDERDDAAPHVDLDSVAPAPVEPTSAELARREWPAPPREIQAVDPAPARLPADQPRSVRENVKSTWILLAVLVGPTGFLNALVGLVYLLFGNAVGREHLFWGLGLTILGLVAYALGRGKKSADDAKRRN